MNVVLHEQISAAILEALADGSALTVDDMVEAAVAAGLDLGPQPHSAVDDILFSDYLPQVVPVREEEYVRLDTLLSGRTFTHRLTPDEVARDYLVMVPDLAAVLFLLDVAPYDRWKDGSPITSLFPGDRELSERGITDVDNEVWALTPGTLGRLGVGSGDLVAVLVHPDGLELTARPDVRTTDATPFDRQTLQDVFADNDEHPIDLHEFMHDVCIASPHAFRTPLPPLGALFEQVGFAVHGDWLVPTDFDFTRWEVDSRVGPLMDAYQLDEDEALAVTALEHAHRQVGKAFDHVADANADTDADPNIGDIFGGIVEKAVPFLATTAVAEAVVSVTIGRTRRDAAALGLLAESLADRVPRAARPHLAWIRGKVMERLGDVLEAERAFEEALTLDGSCYLALVEVAEYASDRGDAVRGLSLLNRAGVDRDDDLRVLLEHFRPVERTDIGRNDKCWCGSGRKYKVCHRNREVVPLEERAAWLYQKAGTYLQSGPFRLELMQLAEARAAYWQHHDALFDALMDPLVSDTMLFEGGVFERFLDERGPLLPADEVLLAQQWLLVDRSVHEVEHVHPGEGLTLRNVLTGEREEVRERTASQSLRPGTFICTRVVPAGDTMQLFGGIEPVSLRERDVLVELLTDDPEPLELVSFLTQRFAPPTLQNATGEPIVACTTWLETDHPEELVVHLDDVFDRAGDQWHDVVQVGSTRRISTLR